MDYAAPDHAELVTPSGLTLSIWRKKEMQDQLETLPSRDLAYFMEGTEYFDDYLSKAVAWAQLFASLNRDASMENVVTALQSVTQKTVRQQQTLAMEEINCHQ